MGGGLMQLVAYGAQDIYLTGNPQITFFKVVYRRHTNFAMESIEQTLNGSADFGNRVTCTISRNGDLIKDVWFETTLPTLSAVASKGYGWVDDVGHALITDAELEIGGQKIDKHYGAWMNIFSDLTTTNEKTTGFNEMRGNIASLEPEGGTGSTSANGTARSAYKVYVPFQFWFCRNAGLALPLIALQYHEVKINININSLANVILQQDSVAGGSNDIGFIVASSPPSVSLSTTSLWATYVYLDTDERRRFAQVSHEYLIEQLQYTGDESVTSATTASLRLNFNHPVKELVWTVLRTDSSDLKQWFNWTDNQTIAAADISFRNEYVSNSNPVSNAKLQLNGHDRFAQRNGIYFSKVQPFQHHTNIPLSPGVNVYSFAIKPEEHQPSGTCNFSRIDNATLQLSFGASTTGVVKIFAINYNVLRVMSGMGGLAYSN